MTPRERLIEAMCRADDPEWDCDWINPGWRYGERAKKARMLDAVLASPDLDAARTEGSAG